MRGEENGDEVRGFKGEGCVTEMFRGREDSGDHVRLCDGEENVTEVRVNEGDVFGDLNMPPVIAGGNQLNSRWSQMERRLEEKILAFHWNQKWIVTLSLPKQPGASHVVCLLACSSIACVIKNLIKTLIKKHGKGKRQWSL